MGAPQFAQGGVGRSESILCRSIGLSFATTAFSVTSPLATPSVMESTAPSVIKSNTTERARVSSNGLCIGHARAAANRQRNRSSSFYTASSQWAGAPTAATKAVVRFEGGLGYRAGSQAPHEAPDQPGRQPHWTAHGRATPAVGQNVPWGGALTEVWRHFHPAGVPLSLFAKSLEN